MWFVFIEKKTTHQTHNTLIYSHFYQNTKLSTSSHYEQAATCYFRLYSQAIS